MTDGLSSSAPSDASDADLPPLPDAGPGGGAAGGDGGGSSGRRLLRANAAVATGTAVSRITGVVRLIALFAATEASLRDAYLLANNTPNIIFELILGGVLTATLVPLFTGHLEDHDDNATDAVVSVTIIALVALSVLAVLAAPLLIALYSSNTPKGVSPGEFRSVGVRLSILFAPQVFFYGVMALGSALLNARRRYFAAAWAPVVNNVIVSAVLFYVAYAVAEPHDLDAAATRPGLMLVLGLGTTAGIIAMALALLPALRMSGYRFHFRPQWRHPSVKKALTLSGWTFGYVIANQVAAAIVNVLAKPGSGGPSDYQIAFMFFQLPHGLLAVSLMTTFQPELSRAAVRGDDPDFNRQLLLGLRLLALVVVPAAVGYFVVPGTFADLGSHLGADVGGLSATRAADVYRIAGVLSGFGLGLIGFSAYLFVLRAFYARKDTRTPFFLNLFENGLNVVVAVALVGALGVRGLSISYGVAYLLAAVLSFAVLVRRVPGFDLAGLFHTLVRIAVAASAMGVAVWVFLRVAIDHDPDRLVPMCLAGIVLGVVLYGALVVALGLLSETGLLDRLRRRRVAS